MCSPWIIKAAIKKQRRFFLIYILSFNNKFDKALLNQQILLSFWSKLATLYMKMTKSAIWGECSIHWDWSVCWAKFRLVHQYIYLYTRTFGHWIGLTHHNIAQLRLISLFPSRLRLAAKCPSCKQALKLCYPTCTVVNTVWLKKISGIGLVFAYWLEEAEDTTIWNI